MRTTKGLLIFVVCAAVLMSSVGCEKKGNIVVDNEAVKLSIIMPEFGRIWRDDNPAIKEIEKITNTKLDVSLVAGGDNYTQKFSVLAASGGLPDIIRLEGFNYQKYADQGLFMDIEGLLSAHGPNLTSILKPESWEVVKWKGKTIGIPYQNTSGKVVTSVRTDWLANLGLSMPENLEEYAVMLEKFTLEDPDKNGSNDTYGMGSDGGGTGNAFMPIYGAHGFQDGQTYIKDGKAYTANISEEYKNAIAFIKGLWDKKLIDPELFIIKSDQANQKLAQSKAGSFTSWWSIPYVLMSDNKMPAITPEAEWEPILPAITGADGKGGMKDMGMVGGTTHINVSSKNGEAAIKLLDFLISKESNYLSGYGIEGVHFERDPERTEIDGVKILPEGRKALDEHWLDPIGQLVGTDIDMAKKAAEFVKKHPDPSVDPIVNKYRVAFSGYANEYDLIVDDFYGLPITEEESKYGVDLVNYEQEMLIKFITGQASLDNWEQYVSDWKAKGGQAIRDSKINIYNDIKGANVTWGN